MRWKWRQHIDPEIHQFRLHRIIQTVQFQRDQKRPRGIASLGGFQMKLPPSVRH
jgi:hypothetical protein